MAEAQTINNSQISVEKIEGCRFFSKGVKAFTLVDGLITGKGKSDGGVKSYAIPFLQVLREYVKDASPKELELIERIVEEKREKIAA